MPTNPRPHRSLLYMPGSNARALEKAKTLDADALIMDLEDSVSPEAKAKARELVVQACQAANNGDYGNKIICIRANALDTQWGEDDLKAAAAANPDAVLLSKVNNAADVKAAERVLTAAGLTEKTALWVMMETPLSILHAEEIAASSPRMGAFVLGTSDLVKDLHAHHTTMRLPVIASLNFCVLAARAYGLEVLDGVYLHLNDPEGFEQSCLQGLEMGFDGKTLIHPKQLEATNRVFAPSPEDIELSKRIIKAHGQAAAEGKGVVVVDGSLIENLHVQNAQRIVALAQSIEQNASIIEAKQ
jgi:citrate lyase subunit beta/citryl-CoA lyase